MEEGNFWSDNEAAQKVIAKCNQLKGWTVPYRDIKKRFEAAKEFLEEVDEEDELYHDLVKELQEIEKGLEELEIKKMLSGELDNKSCYLSVNAGAGGTESCDWAQMLLRMYQKWATKRGWKVEVIEKLDGEVAGIKNATLRFTGPFAYGYAKAEKGVHRLVRISPFDSNARRHTSFVSVDVTPEIEDDIQIEIRPDEIRIDTFRAQGAGGQHVNTTDSAVRITHIKTGIVVSCQGERSQLQNKETCFKMLRSKLYEKEVLEREAAVKKMGGEKKEIAWGSQIRNYVFQPYTLVKDTRTKYEEGNIQEVMDGEIDGFVNAYLKEFSE
ncbi:Peptide chain release factor 2 [Candidatus Neptunochlamydia vexilliferae]|uniref:Peptide chain release factor 2 n=2 Tax=Candidatus Neptunichlamydia vexilliferae TaxID=1651774 RepID=A0ABS0B032_9BACT|nr:Peptide chain release factor 2 [Candidatus Neptunochlamydia vexilliferae]